MYLSMWVGGSMKVMAGITMHFAVNRDLNPSFSCGRAERTASVSLSPS